MDINFSLPSIFSDTNDDGLGQCVPLILLQGLGTEQELSRKKRHKNKKILGSLCDKELLKKIPTRRIEFRFASDEITRPVRQAYGRNLRKDFIKTAHDELLKKGKHFFLEKDLLKSVKHYDIHHKLPVAFGGSNDDDNLILIDRDVHKAIHRAIDKKTSGIQNKLKDHRSARRPRSISLKNDLESIRGVYLEEDGKIMMDIPFPEGRVFFPRFLFH